MASANVNDARFIQTENDRQKNDIEGRDTSVTTQDHIDRTKTERAELEAPTNYLVERLQLFPPPSRPPSILLAYLSPWTRDRVGLLSLGRGVNWAGAISWQDVLDGGNDIALLLQSTPFEVLWPLSIDDIDTSEVALKDIQWLGFNKFDEEMMMACAQLPNLKKMQFWFVWIDRDDEIGFGGWKLHDIRLLSDEERKQMRWYASISDAERDQHEGIDNTSSDETTRDEGGQDEREKRDTGGREAIIRHIQRTVEELRGLASSFGIGEKEFVEILKR
ncbi:hypothetical protein PROFUN_08967 [Planoprotostelium fungivorum]|uniref:Uncharacterized protein n=1 Tax=Planoprotostelium fungivorum TaxID=1890364 RepID=A0A2P6N6R5_9EUKA|nr:hypothetical protein PROFUN_10544 [Planoprotostelium fungivorum]PRP83769.1 hypothetical protein PROFUN_08967 [Planoprotostelium fungivorum]